MKRNTLNVVVSIALLGVAASGFANEAQPELQPTRVEFGSFKMPVDATRYAPVQSATEQQSYRFITDSSPL